MKEFSYFISYRAGALWIPSLGKDKYLEGLANLKWDRRLGGYCTHAIQYRELIRHLYKKQVHYKDLAKAYNTLSINIQKSHIPYDYQTRSLEEWNKMKHGVVVLPTGAGKSYLACLIMEKIQRSVLILVPTIDLLNQWASNLHEIFGVEISKIGDNNFEIGDIVVSTYDSGRIHAEQLGNRFGLIVFDECHHLPSTSHSYMARSFIAPYRLGLTATHPQEPEKQSLLKELCGDIVYEVKIGELSGEYLAPYQVKTLHVSLTQEEREIYENHRSIYLDFLRQTPNFSGKGSHWEQFIFHAHRTAEGRNALKSYHIQKNIAVAASNKFTELAKIICHHSKERILIFTNDNQTAYLISCHFFIPLITHETKNKERKIILEHFKIGRWPYLVSSRVLNEGIDLPEASIAVIISGTGVVREHVQRLGRILRKKDGKQAILFEMITEDTGEVYTSQRRREHEAYNLI